MVDGRMATPSKKHRKDLIYKIKNRDTSRYNGLAMDSVLSFEDAVECYRVVTGACAFGTKNFVEDVLASKDRKDSYTIGEMIELTKGQYKAEKFAAFSRSNRIECVAER